MENSSFNAYGFTIEGHAGGRRVWPRSFKRFVQQKLDAGELTVDQVMTDCNISKSFVYKWRSDLKRDRGGTSTCRENHVFSEVIMTEIDEPDTTAPAPSKIELRTGKVQINLPANFPIADLIKVVLAVESTA